jgi:hypothetical protein
MAVLQQLHWCARGGSTVPSRLSRRPFWLNSATHSKRMVELSGHAKAPTLVCRRPARGVTQICSERFMLKRWLGCSEGDSTEWRDCSSSTGVHEKAAWCRAGYLGGLPGRILPRTANEWLNLDVAPERLYQCSEGARALSRWLVPRTSCSNPDCSRTTQRSCPIIAKLEARLQLKVQSQRRHVHRRWSQFAAECFRTTRRSCPLHAKLDARLQLKAQSPVWRDNSDSFLVEFCHAQQTNG